MVLTEELLRELPRECVLLELASQPGFDRAAAEARGLKCIAAPGLPGRAAPETAARAIKATLEKNMGGRSMRTERIGFALCGSFCNHPKILMLFEEMAESFELVPILSENTARYDTRFGLADDLIARVERGGASRHPHHRGGRAVPVRKTWPMSSSSRPVQATPLPSSPTASPTGR